MVGNSTTEGGTDCWPTSFTGSYVCICILVVYGMVVIVAAAAAEVVVVISLQVLVLVTSFQSSCEVKKHTRKNPKTKTSQPNWLKPIK